MDGNGVAIGLNQKIGNTSKNVIRKKPRRKCVAVSLPYGNKLDNVNDLLGHAVTSEAGLATGTEGNLAVGN